MKILIQIYLQCLLFNLDFINFMINQNLKFPVLLIDYRSRLVNDQELFSNLFNLSIFLI